MQLAKRQTGASGKKIGCVLNFCVGLMLLGGKSGLLGAQTVQVSSWSSELDHSLESTVVFQPYNREQTVAHISFNEDLLGQQISEIKVVLPPRDPASAESLPAGASFAPVPSMDEQADTLIVKPIRAGAVTLSPATASNLDFLLMMQMYRDVKPKAYLLASTVTGAGDVESLAFRNPDGSYVLLSVNHAESSVGLDAHWKDGIFTYTQMGHSIALFVWNPKEGLISLVPDESQATKGTTTLEAKCSALSPLGIDFRCSSQSYRCSVFPVRLSCGSAEKIQLSVVAHSGDKNEIDCKKPGFLTVTATPEVGAPTTLQLPYCSAGTYAATSDAAPATAP